MKITQHYVNGIAYKIVGCAMEVHNNLGPGLLESVYQKCLIDELKSQGLKTESEVLVKVLYKNKDLGCSLRIDILVEDLVIVEVKAVDILIPIFSAQLLTYLKLTDKPKGLLINFNCQTIKGNLIPLVTSTFSSLPKI